MKSCLIQEAQRQAQQMHKFQTMAALETDDDGNPQPTFVLGGQIVAELIEVVRAGGASPYLMTCTVLAIGAIAKDRALLHGFCSALQKALEVKP